MVGWHLRPISLVQVLADVYRFWVVGAAPLDGYRPVDCRPEDLDTCGARAGAPSSRPANKSIAVGIVDPRWLA